MMAKLEADFPCGAEVEQRIGNAIYYVWCVRLV